MVESPSNNGAETGSWQQVVVIAIFGARARREGSGEIEITTSIGPRYVIQYFAMTYLVNPDVAM